MNERAEGEGGRCRVATWGGNEAGASQLVPVQLGQPVDRLADESRTGVRKAVPLLVQRRIPEPEVGPEVDDQPDDVNEGRHDRLGQPGREGDEDDVTSLEIAGLQGVDHEVPVRRRQGRI